MDGGGVLIKQAIHCLDLLIYIVGQPKAWQAFCSSRLGRSETEDTAVVSLDFQEGHGMLMATTAYKDSPTPGTCLLGSAESKKKPTDM